MKFLIVVPDGSADDPIDSLGGRTPLEAACLPCIDGLAQRGIIGTCRTVPAGISPGSDSANLSVMGYDPRVYLTGRSPLEAGALGIEMKDDDESFRVNFITLTPAESGVYADFSIKDHAAGDLTTEEADELLKVISRAFATENIKFYLGTQYRECMIISGRHAECVMTPPHDILDRRLGDYLPCGRDGRFFAAMNEKSYELLKDHPLNKAREARGLNPANGIWIWGQGTRPKLPDFGKKYNVRGSVISAVDLIKGIGMFAGLQIIEVEGATGSIHTNFEAKAEAAIDAYERGRDFVYLHLEGTDECSHQGSLEKKIRCAEYIDQRAVKPVVEYLQNCGDDFKILVVPDHRTPLALRTHTADPVPFVIYDSRNPLAPDSRRQFNERAAAAAGLHFDNGYEMTDFFFERKV